MLLLSFPNVHFSRAKLMKVLLSLKSGTLLSDTLIHGPGQCVSVTGDECLDIMPNRKEGQR